MPFEVRKDNNKFCVFNTDTDENKGCSDSRDQAVAHLKALYANEAEMAAEEVISVLDADEEILSGDNYIFSDGMKEYPWAGPIVFENVTTGDNRIFKADSINWQEDTLPWAFRWQKASGQGHAGSVPVGRVDRIERKEDGSIHGYGVVIPELSTEADEYYKILKAGVGGGVSVDGDSAHFDIQDQKDGSQPRVEFSSMRLRALSAVDIPAFNGARIHLIEEDSEPTEFVDEATEELLETVDLDELAAKTKDGETKDDKSPQDNFKAMIAAKKEKAKDGETKDGKSPQDNFKAMIAAKKEKAKKKVEASNGWNIDDALIATAIPTLPSTEAFTDPEFSGPTPLTVTTDGKVFGHLALFNTCHIGFPGTCVKPPKGSKYQYFHTGEIETAEGDLVQVGRLTFKTGHADMNATPRIAADHYDNTGAVAADVRAGEDKFGIWVVGALRPHLSDEDIRAFRAAPLSGDWRRIAGKLELVGALGVNTPGFPVPRVRAMVASGETETLFTFLEGDDEEFCSSYEFKLRQDKKGSLAFAIEKSLQVDPEPPAGKIVEEVPPPPKKTDYEAKANNYDKNQLLTDLQHLRDLLDDPEVTMPKRVRDGYEQLYKAFTLLLESGAKFSDNDFDLDIISASGLETEEWKAQLELSGLDVIEFFNQCHDANGKFCGGKGGGGATGVGTSTRKGQPKAVSGRHWVDNAHPGTPEHGSDVPGESAEAHKNKSRDAGGHTGGSGKGNKDNKGKNQQQDKTGGVIAKTYENFRTARTNYLRWGAAAAIAAAALNSPISGLLQGIATSAGLAMIGSPAMLGLIFITSSAYATKNYLAARRHRQDYNTQVDRKIRVDKAKAVNERNIARAINQ
jgi:hypothetical protein